MHVDGPLPKLARHLGLAGLLPFLAFGLLVALTDGWQRNVGLQVLVAYGGIILAFVSAVHWGLGLAGREGAPARFAGAALGAAVAWGAVALLPASRGCLALALGFTVVQAAEERAKLSRSYLALRRVQTAVAAAMLLLAWLAATA